jgi:hypothetical protein
MQTPTLSATINQVAKSDILMHPHEAKQMFLVYCYLKNVGKQTASIKTLELRA